jgi:hypothetical protein
MAKPIPKKIEFDLAGGSVLIQDDVILVTGAHDDTAGLSLNGNKPEVAAVLLALAQHILKMNGDDEVSKSVLLEAGLLEAFALRGPLNEVKVSKVSNEGDESKSRSHTLLTEETEQSLLAAGVEKDVIRFLGTINGCARALNNNSVNPAKAARTMMEKPWAKKAFPVWLKKNPAPAPEPWFCAGCSTNLVKEAGELCSDCLQKNPAAPDDPEDLEI